MEIILDRNLLVVDYIYRVGEIIKTQEGYKFIIYFLSNREYIIDKNYLQDEWIYKYHSIGWKDPEKEEKLKALLNEIWATVSDMREFVIEHVVKFRDSNVYKNIPRWPK